MCAKSLADLTAAESDGEVLPDHTFSPFSLRDFGFMENQIGQKHILGAMELAQQFVNNTAYERLQELKAHPIDSTDGKKLKLEIPSIAETVLKQAKEDKLTRRFRYGTLWFDAAVTDYDFDYILLYLSLRKNTPGMTLEKAKSLINEGNAWQIRAVLQALIFGELPKGPAPMTETAKVSSPQGQEIGNLSLQDLTTTEKE